MQENKINQLNNAGGVASQPKRKSDSEPLKPLLNEMITIQQLKTHRKAVHAVTLKTYLIEEIYIKDQESLHKIKSQLDQHILN